MNCDLSTSPFGDIGRLFQLLSKKRKHQALALAVLSVVAATAEVAVLGLVVPFLSLVVSPEQALTNSSVRGLAGMFGIAAPEGLLLPVTIAFAAVAFGAGVVRLLLLYASIRFFGGTASELSAEAYRRALYQPYEVHITLNTADVITTIKAKLDGVIGGSVQPAFFLFSSTILLVAIVGALLVIDPVVASVAFATFGGAYLLATILARRRIQHLGKVMTDNQVLTLKSLHEGLNGIRDVLLSGAQEQYATNYRLADYPQRRAAGGVTFISQGVRYLVEVVAMILIAALAYALAQQPGGAAVSVPTLGALALGGLRLLPMMQQLFGSWSLIQGHAEYMRDVLRALTVPVPSGSSGADFEPLTFECDISLKNVSYTYAPHLLPSIKEVNLTIRKGARIGIVGPTGGGKSTLADIIMGLLHPQQGSVEVDGVKLDPSNVPRWHRQVAHVPQSIYLIDGSVAANIALGDASRPMDLDRVKRSAEAAQIADFVQGMSGGFEASTGEDGISLSGGQRQRIGIARALYKKASLLALDEATSALDTKTEDQVMSALHEQEESLTIIMIAHRVSTLRECDLIVRVANGEIQAMGTFEQVIGRRDDAVQSKVVPQ